MVNAVLLQGFLSRKKLERALLEIKAIDNSENDDDGLLRLVISSTEGDALAAVSFVENILVDTDFDKIEMKVYEASSTAAFIVLALSGLPEVKVEMDKNAILGIHRGEIRLSPTQIDQDRRVDEELATAFKKYSEALVEVMKVNGLTDPAYLSDLYATDWLRLSAEVCVKRGIAGSLF